VKTALKGKMFQDAVDTKKNVMAEMNVVPLEGFADCFQKLCSDSTNVLRKQAEINVNRNKIKFNSRGSVLG
jgi:hypothetical protein